MLVTVGWVTVGAVGAVAAEAAVPFVACWPFPLAGTIGTNLRGILHLLIYPVPHLGTNRSGWVA